MSVYRVLSLRYLLQRWDRGLRPSHDAPVSTMNTFRDDFLSAYGSPPPSE